MPSWSVGTDFSSDRSGPCNILQESTALLQQALAQEQRDHQACSVVCVFLSELEELPLLGVCPDGLPLFGDLQATRAAHEVTQTALASVSMELAQMKEAQNLVGKGHRLSLEDVYTLVQLWKLDIRPEMLRGSGLCLQSILGLLTLDAFFSCLLALSLVPTRCSWNRDQSNRTQGPLGLQLRISGGFGVFSAPVG
eukprot:m.526973 g.526973  ORF g.526973 m.526973 type:complete len:195 (-) comp57557_c0_seq24:34-618(-)